MNKATITSDTAQTIDNANLPPEIVTELLYRLPVKSLCRIKCVSPSWKTLISSPHFVQTHLTRTKANNNKNLAYKAILFSGTFDLYSVDFADPTPKRLDHPPFNHMRKSRSVSSCNGLVLVSDHGCVNFLLNPSTREWKALPYPLHGYTSMDSFFPPGLGYVSSTDDYKVAMPFFDAGLEFNDGAVTVVVVYSLKTGAWRIIHHFPYKPVGRGRRGVCFNERLHWLCRRTVGLDDSKVVVAFDLVDEIFKEVQLPVSYDDDSEFTGDDDSEFTGYDMVVLEGCLCLLFWSNGDRIDVWMMMEYGVRESWANFCSIANPGASILNVLCLSAQDELVLRRERWRAIEGRVEDEFDGEKLILCDLKKGTRREVLVPGIPTTFLVGDHYIETLVSPYHGGRFLETM